MENEKLYKNDNYYLDIRDLGKNINNNIEIIEDKIFSNYPISATKEAIEELESVRRKIRNDAEKLAIERDETKAEKDPHIKAEKALDRFSAQLNRTREELEQERRFLEAKAEKLSRKEAELKDKEKAVEEKLKELQVAEEGLNKRESALANIEVQKDPRYELIG